MSARVYPSQKYKVIEAAERLIMEGGPGALKTDALIEASGLSKGGFFYHFKTLDDLYYELGQKNWRDFLERVREEAATDPVKTGRMCRAYVRVSFFGPNERKKNVVDINKVFLAVALANPKILERIRKDNLQTDAKFFEMTQDDGLPAEKVRLIQMAADGVWFNQIIGFIEMTKKERREFQDYLLDLTRPGKR